MSFLYFLDNIQSTPVHCGKAKRVKRNNIKKNSGGGHWLNAALCTVTPHLTSASPCPISNFSSHFLNLTSFFFTPLLLCPSIFSYHPCFLFFLSISLPFIQILFVNLLSLIAFSYCAFCAVFSTTILPRSPNILTPPHLHFFFCSSPYYSLFLASSGTSITPLFVRVESVLSHRFDSLARSLSLRYILRGSLLPSTILSTAHPGCTLHNHVSVRSSP